MSCIVNFPIQGRKLSKSAEAVCSRVYLGASCAAEVIHKGNGLHAMRIVLRGDAAHFPSTSNDRAVRFTRTRTGENKLSVGHTDSAIGRMEAARMLFRDAISGYPGEYPSFKAEPVHVAAFLAAKPGRWDSHNFAKPIGDWLESLALIENDSAAEILCVKKSDYLEMFPEQYCTEIVIQRRENVEVLNEAYIGAVRCAALPAPGRMPDADVTRGEFNPRRSAQSCARCDAPLQDSRGRRSVEKTRGSAPGAYTQRDGANTPLSSE